MWGFGGKQNYRENLNNVQAGLRGVDKISFTYGTFSAVLINGSMVPGGCRVLITFGAFAVVWKDGQDAKSGQKPGELTHRRGALFQALSG